MRPWLFPAKQSTGPILRESTGWEKDNSKIKCSKAIVTVPSSFLLPSYQAAEKVMLKWVCVHRVGLCKGGGVMLLPQHTPAFVRGDTYRTH